MEVKPVQRPVEQQISATPDTHSERTITVREATQAAAAQDLQKIAARIGKLIAYVRAILLGLVQRELSEKEQLNNSGTSRVIPKEDSAHASLITDFEVVEVTPDSPVTFRPQDLSTIYCFDLNRFEVKYAADWIARAKENNRVLPQILVVGPRRRLSNSEFQFITDEIAPLAVYLPRPANAASSADLLRLVREELVKVMEPQRLKVENGFEAAGEAHRVVVPGG